MVVPPSLKRPSKMKRQKYGSNGEKPLYWVDEGKGTSWYLILLFFFFVQVQLN